MNTLRLAGVEVPRIGLGTNRLTNTDEHVDFIRRAVEAGVRHIDTAHLYAGGESEQVVGAALAGDRDDVLVATKGGYNPGEGRPEVLNAQIEQSLRALRTESIGLYYLHRIDPDTPLEESLGAIGEHVDRGDIRHVGISAVGVAEIERARKVVPVAAVQNEYSLSERGHDDVVNHCTAHASCSCRTSRCAGRRRRRWRSSPPVTACPGTRSSSPGCCTARRPLLRSPGRSRSSTCARTSQRSSCRSATRSSPRSADPRCPPGSGDSVWGEVADGSRLRAASPLERAKVGRWLMLFVRCESHPTPRRGCCFCLKGHADRRAMVSLRRDFEVIARRNAADQFGRQGS